MTAEFDGNPIREIAKSQIHSDAPMFFEIDNDYYVANIKQGLISKCAYRLKAAEHKIAQNRCKSP